MSDPNFSYADDSMPPVKRGLIRLVEAATGQRKLRRLYLANRRDGVAGEGFFAAAVRSLAIDVRYDPAALAAVPATGPVVVVANHPYGVLDGIVVSWLVQKVRPDFLVLTNAVLLRAPEIADYVLPVDFAPTEEATRTNVASRAAARRHLDGGGCVVVFPAGAISTAPDRLGRHRAIDGPWQPFTAQLIQRARATVVPIRFEGQNSRLFQIASHLSPVLRLSLIFHEVRSRIGTVLPVAVGRPIPFAALPPCPDRQGLADHLKAVTYGLSSAHPMPGPGRHRAERPLGALARRVSSGERAVAHRLAEGGRSAPAAIGRHALVGQPQALGRDARLPEDVDRHPAARVPIAPDAQPAGRQPRDDVLADPHRAVLVEGPVVAEGREVHLQRLGLDEPPVRRIVDDEVGEVGLRRDRAERGELGRGEAARSVRGRACRGVGSARGPVGPPRARRAGGRAGRAMWGVRTKAGLPGGDGRGDKPPVAGGIPGSPSGRRRSAASRRACRPAHALRPEHGTI